MSRKHLVKKQVVDKNGHLRTVRVLPEGAKKSKGRVAVAAKVAPANSNAGSRQTALNDLNAALTALNKLDVFDIFPLDVQRKAIAAANNPDLTTDDLALVKELSEACESWNFHATSMRLSAALGRRAHAENPEAPLTDPYSMAFDPDTSPELLRFISDSEPNEMRIHSMAQNPSTPSDILSRFANSETKWIREEAANNSSLSFDDIRKLAADDYWRSRYNIAGNPSTPTSVLAELAKDDEDLVAEEAAKALKKRNKR
jgi:hypothetical protein